MIPRATIKHITRVPWALWGEYAKEAASGGERERVQCTRARRVLALTAEAGLEQVHGHDVVQAALVARPVRAERGRRARRERDAATEARVRVGVWRQLRELRELQDAHRGERRMHVAIAIRLENAILV